MDTFRAFEGDSICGQSISKIEDYQSLEVTDKSDGSTQPLDFPKSNVLGFSFKSGDKLYLRPSGTEPKIKFYIMITENDGSLDNKKQIAHKKTQEFLDYIKSVSDKA